MQVLPLPLLHFLQTRAKRGKKVGGTMPTTTTQLSVERRTKNQQGKKKKGEKSQKSFPLPSLVRSTPKRALLTKAASNRSKYAHLLLRRVDAPVLGGGPGRRRKPLRRPRRGLRSPGGRRRRSSHRPRRRGGAQEGFRPLQERPRLCVQGSLVALSKSARAAVEGATA